MLCTHFSVHLTATLHVSLQDRCTSVTSILLQKHPVFTLNPLQGAGDLIVGCALGRFEFSALFEIHLGFVFAAQLQIAQSTEITCPRVLTPCVNGFRQVLIGARVFLREVGMNTQPVELAECSLLAASRGSVEEGKASKK